MPTNKYDASYYIEKLKLKPLLSTDFLMEYYRTPDYLTVDEEKFAMASFVYYLLPKKTIFPLHKMKCYSSWHFCAGSPLILYNLSKACQVEKIIIGTDLSSNHFFSHITPKDTWFCAESTGEFSLVSHCICPAYYECLEERGFLEDLILEYPEHKEFIERFSTKNKKNSSYILSEKEYQHQPVSPSLLSGS